ncbi:hypothetical protein J8273_5445 [Carpediemonas membranifera]|uniref:Uncharacterized protein n=1 Tax=Carpediemonas membranifera TaxID=201153 RepID=A0A8J6E0N4_9EUKA|nr:hypothetical protein J8273_5445 [Carpediemonas membranifera]|eukprot:KAG9392453.1 hypothetical protein J8273_5445 [Carpediemonas membranifera]
MTIDDTNLDAKILLTEAYRLALIFTTCIPGDVPGHVHHAYQRQLNERLPKRIRSRRLFHDILLGDVTTDTASDEGLDALHQILSQIPPLKPSAQVILDRARSILASSPPLSMNVELTDGEELPVALHTLLQGTLWACLMGGGANPDLEDRMVECRSWLFNPNIHNNHRCIRNTLAPEAKYLWFLCKKFFFTMNVATKDGESYQYSQYHYFYHHCMYMGRLFMLHIVDDGDSDFAFNRATMPRALEVYSDEITHIAKTPKGLWGWGDNRLSQLGFESSDFADPTRLTFPACPKIAALETSLPPWEKHRMVTEASIQGKQTFILTPVGTVMAGARSTAARFVGTVEEENRFLFNPVAVPHDFVPDHIMHDNWTVILFMGDRQMINGYNHHGQLGLGHLDDLIGFVDLPFRVDGVVVKESDFTVFLSGDQLLFAGLVPQSIPLLGLLPGSVWNYRCSLTPLKFPTRVKGWGYTRNWNGVVWVGDGVTHCCKGNGIVLNLDFEATSFDPACRSFCNRAGQWFDFYWDDAKARPVKSSVPRCPHDVVEIIPVDVAPNPQ